MAINLTAKYASAIQKLYTHSSFLRPHCKANVEMTGAKSCRVYMLKTNPVVDYNRSGTSRYGELKDVQDIVNEYIMTQDKAFNGVVDKGDESEQAISNKSALWLRQEIAEQCVPTGDKYGFAQLAKLGHINGVTAEPAKSTIVSMVYDAATHMDENLVPESGRVLFIRAKDKSKIVLSDEWSGLDSLAGKQLPTGVVGQIAGFTVVTVPSNMFPADVYMIAMHTSAVAFPYRINDTKIHNDPVGVSGAVIEGRQTYDLFVLASKAEAVVVVAKAASRQACSVSIASHSATVTAADADEIWYTLDGSDPRFSMNRKQVATGGTVATTAGQTIRVVAFGKNGKLTSDVSEATDN